MIFILASNNSKKLAEMRGILSPLGIELLSQSEAGLSIEVEENGSTFEENSRLKALGACDLVNAPCIADDSGLCVDAPDGAPGVYSARYCGRHGDDEANNDKLLAALGDLPREKRCARFVSAVCLWLPDGRSLTAMGECPGWVGFERRGTNGFGYDPIFYVGEKSYAELTDEEKDGLSHRGKALALLEQAMEAFMDPQGEFSGAGTQVTLREKK